MNPLAPLLALAAPFVLWPVELYLPYPHIIEELVKGALIWLNPKFKTALAVGLAFSFSESVLYIFNFHPLRLVFTTALHTGTVLVIYSFARLDKRLIPAGVILAGLIHYLYNSLIGVSLGNPTPSAII